MADKTKAEALATSLASKPTSPDFQNERAFCTDGTQATSINEVRAKGRAQPDVGELCLGLVQFSAGVSLDPARKAARPDQDLLAMYKAFAADKGFGPDAMFISDELGAKVLKLYNDTNAIPARRAATVVDQPIASKPGKSWVFTPGSAFDAAFSKVVLDTAAGQPVPSLQGIPASKLAATTESCFQTAKYAFDNNVSIGDCADAGKEQGALFMAKRGRMSAAK